MGMVEWHDDFSVGIVEIDEQHKTIIAMINKISKAAGAFCGAYSDALKKDFLALFESVQLHLVTEEKFMLLYHYPGYEEHKKEHDSFFAKLQDFRVGVIEGRALGAAEIIDFMAEWYLYHLREMDRQYALFFQEKGLADPLS